MKLDDSRKRGKKKIFMFSGEVDVNQLGWVCITLTQKQM